MFHFEAKITRSKQREKLEAKKAKKCEKNVKKAKKVKKAKNYETILCSHIYMTNPCYAERIKTVCEDRRTVEFSSKFAWISFIAFGEFLIHVNKFRDYKNSSLRSSLNTQQTCGGNLPKFPYTYICCSSMFNSVSRYTRIFIFLQCIVPYPASWIFTSVLCALCPV